MILEIMGTNYLRGVASSCNLSENTPPPPATLGCNNNHTTTGGVSTDTHNRSKQKGGFTLVELSIVLIIIGLIVGGVLGGQSLIKSAELQRVVNELNQYKTAINAFRLEYSAIPGDMDNAQDYWGDNCASDTTYKDKCNGDGNGGVDDNHEEFNVFRHLSLAGIVPGSFSGFTGQTNNAFTVGVDIPKSATGGGLGYQFDFAYAYPQGCQKSLFGAECDYAPSGHLIIPLRGGGGDNKDTPINEISVAWEKSFTPKNLGAIDTKIDDGVPLQGFLVSYPNNKANSGLSGCLALNGSVIDRDDITDANVNDAIANANYNFAKQENVCATRLQVF